MTYSGMHRQSREKLSLILSSAGKVVTIEDASRALSCDRITARNFLSRMHRSGWLKMITHGVYAPVDLSSDDAQYTEEDPYSIGTVLFKKCYIGAWSAANHWGLTDQLFLNTWVFTTQKVRKRHVKKGANNFCLFHVAEKDVFGTITEWIGPQKILISDVHRTLIDFTNHVDFLGLQSLIDVFDAYLLLPNCQLETVYDYISRLGNRALFKKLGFLISLRRPDQGDLWHRFQISISKGPSFLASQTKCDVYLKEWNMYVPQFMVTQ